MTKKSYARQATSLWLDTLPSLDYRAPLDGNVTCDVAIIGAGLTGLWTAYYLSEFDPSLDIAVIERETAGFGPSGRNGGWLTSGMAGTPGAFGIRPHSPEHRAAEAATREAVDEVGRVVAAEGIDCDYLKAGMLAIANTAPQEKRLRANLANDRKLGLGDDDVRQLSVDEVATYARIPDMRIGSLNRAAARVNPAKLTRGLADVCERRGVTIYEGTEALEYGPRKVRCASGTVTAKHVIRATESYTVQMKKESRRFLPLYSLMIATEPLPQTVWDEIGWSDGLLIQDTRHLFFYAQRTADGRIAIGGRGAPYDFGSPISRASEENEQVKTRLIGALKKHFPAVGNAEITHHWGGSLGVPRDWTMSVTYDSATGVGSSGGYSGHGVAAANIGGKALAHLITEKDDAGLSQPWIGHKSRNWEPEPLRFIASRAIISILEKADNKEDATGKVAHSALLVSPFMPGH
ncbi:glycine/D-amino acid oxidase-like deaminating enzyme [Leucobacter exalbidus]|uniref:Glycine/D-amino acid oxidase-like deaminating enzyme n=1 Tax=Leucobacter exalbidus TaxID=662960 RepID=A0A940T3P5_9MICO|nr:FAD-dependent oxidoreductase [Leucobacter exalbidus]MBP1326028.1 glycine/D-amino acid oxidase-like deaminating enzyme [Leucobacter exalbidus]